MQIFDYQQVAFNKTVAGFEWILKEVLSQLLKSKLIDCSEKAVIEKINSGDEWCSFDDSHITEKMRILLTSSNEKTVQYMCKAILCRRGPKLVGSVEYIGKRADENVFSLREYVVKELLLEWVDKFDIPKPYWHIWTNSTSLTKIGSTVAISRLIDGAGEREKDKYEQALRIHNPNDNTSSPIMEISSSLMSLLADQALYAMRVYVLLTPETEHLRPQIESEVQKNKLINWK